MEDTSLKGKDSLEELGVDGEVVLELNIKGSVVRLCASSPDDLTLNVAMIVK
jgi:hypothetical protein